MGTSRLLTMINMSRAFFRQASTVPRLAISPARVSVAPALRPASVAAPIRCFSLSPSLLKRTSWQKAEPVEYDELKPLTEQPTDDILLLDVREPVEVVQGNIPSSVNVPLSEMPEALKMDDADFFRKYAFRKPSKDQKIIVHCKAGKRSQTVLDQMKGMGWEHSQLHWLVG